MLKSKTFIYQKINHKDSEKTGPRVEKDSCNTHNQIQHSDKTSINQQGKDKRLNWKMEEKYKQFPYEEKKTNKK